MCEAIRVSIQTAQFLKIDPEEASLMMIENSIQNSTNSNITLLETQNKFIPLQNVPVEVNSITVAPKIPPIMVRQADDLKDQLKTINNSFLTPKLLYLENYSKFSH
ncbi:hypothetical protein CEXT_180361 [Caerostris extrusa]|uniref:Uncharacterized protein n=1 Tax=Caerostris extrusa TaxID=172846 RepID=A0AAV4XVF8_CAEEX|nr:hypothetical protein CEXT_180361 [Caerostris extrusa]